MAKTALKKEKWTLTFDHDLKSRLQKEARKLRVYPVQLLETMVRQQLNPYGFQSIKDNIAYVNAMRLKSGGQSDKKFLADIKKWEKR